MRSPHCFCEGTFKVCPPQFTQLCTIHGIFNNSILPLIYALLPGKTNSDYRRLFQCISSRDNFMPSTVVVDLEALNVRQLLALAFVPPNDVISSFEQIQNFPFFNNNIDILQSLLYHMEDNIIGRYLRPPQRRTPMFPHTLWNQFDASIFAATRMNPQQYQSITRDFAIKDLFLIAFAILDLYLLSRLGIVVGSGFLPYGFDPSTYKKVEHTVHDREALTIDITSWLVEQLKTL
ncbi:hypothetical protein RF11_09609 [Thelohanellus kitauei]|uniref:Uncharacterized protein n=1 Tax=Thelohanellus kitauei TaxID=669202 RepID=A0A0C2J9D2_THEKT|nr:hypothetical protein RF11_09609 [Thelohanellus kitauei]